MCGFEVSLWPQLFCEEYVDKYSCLENVVYGLSDLNIDLLIFCMSVEIVLVDGVLWKQQEWDAHVLVSVEWGTKVKCFDIHTHVFHPFCAQHTIPQDF